MNSRIVLQLDPSSRNGRNSEATFVTLTSGRILLVWSKFNSADHSDYGSGVIAARYSDDGGLTWSTKDRVLVKKDRGATNVMSPSLLRLQDGRIALLYLRKVGFTICMPYICFSEDEAETFTAPVAVAGVPGDYGVNNDRLIQLNSGRIIMPVCMLRRRSPWERTPMERLPGDTNTIYPDDLEPFLAMPTLIFFYFSDDGGQTWLESKTSYYHCFPDGSGLQEPGMVELADGTLWSWTRTGHIGTSANGMVQWSSFSTDEGRVWSPPEPSIFLSPCSPMQVKRIPKTGHLLAVWNDHSDHFKVPPPEPISWARTPLVSAISTDEGKTWGHYQLIESAPDHGFCYPAIHFTDEAVLLAYNAGGASSQDCLDTQRVRWIPLKEMYNE